MGYSEFQIRIFPLALRLAAKPRLARRAFSSDYEHALGFEREIRPDAPASLKFGRQKINVHERDRTFEPKAARPTLGAADFCLITHRPMDEIISHLNDCGVTPALGHRPAINEMIRLRLN